MALSVGSILVVIFLVIATAVTIFGNGLVILAWVVHKPIRTPQNAYIVSLAFADILVGLFVLPLDLWMEVAILDNIGLCKSRLIGIIGLGTVSIFHLTAIAWDRYKVITYGVAYIQHRTTRSTMQIILTMWVISFWVASPPLLDNESWVLKPNLCYYNKGVSWVIHGTLSAFIFPSILMIKMYTNVFYGIQEKLRKRHNNATATGTTPSHSCDESSATDDGLERKLKNNTIIQNVKLEKVSLSRERRTLRTLGIIVGCFLFCWSPFFGAHVFKEFVSINQRVIVYLSYLGHANSAVNPIIYSIFNRDFKIAFLKILTFGRK